MTNSLFNQDKPQTDVVTQATSYTNEDLIGEGKKYKDEATALESVAASQSYIAKLEAEKASMIAEMTETRDKLAKTEAVGDIKSLIEAAVAKQAPVTPANPNEEHQVADPQPEVKVGLTQEDVEQFLQQRDKEASVASNLSKVKADLELKYGDNTQAVLRVVAAKTGWSEQQLNDMAASNPVGFLTLVEVGASPDNSGKPSPASTLVGDTNSAATIDLQQINKPPAQTRAEYWRDWPANNGKRFRDANAEMQMQAEMAKMGEAFFGR